MKEKTVRPSQLFSTTDEHIVIPPFIMISHISSTKRDEEVYKMEM